MKLFALLTVSIFSTISMAQQTSISFNRDLVKIDNPTFLDSETQLRFSAISDYNQVCKKLNYGKFVINSEKMEFTQDSTATIDQFGKVKYDNLIDRIKLTSITCLKKDSFMIVGKPFEKIIREGGGIVKIISPKFKFGQQYVPFSERSNKEGICKAFGYNVIYSHNEKVERTTCVEVNSFGNPEINSYYNVKKKIFVRDYRKYTYTKLKEIVTRFVTKDNEKSLSFFRDWENNKIFTEYEPLRNDENIYNDDPYLRSCDSIVEEVMCQ